jgi:hypothetical protein
LARPRSHDAERSCSIVRRGRRPGDLTARWLASRRRNELLTESQSWPLPSSAVRPGDCLAIG